MILTKLQEENINKLLEEGIIQDKEGFIRDAVSKHLNKSEIKKQLKKITDGGTIKSEKDVVRRIGTKFNDEIESIKKARKKKKQLKVSSGEITNMILKHDKWLGIKGDLINHDFEKK